MAVRAYSAAVEDYLRGLYKLEEAGVRPTTTRLAQALGVSPGSATEMLKRLADLGLVERLAYRGASLTAAGRDAALRVTRQHRLIERYLAETLDMPLDQLDAEADRLEHKLSPELEGRIDRALGRPTHDPHGHPIPSADLEPGARTERTLAHLEPGEQATVRQIPDDDSTLLQYLDAAGLVPGARVDVTAAGPFGDPVTARTAKGETAVARAIATLVQVT